MLRNASRQPAAHALSRPRRPQERALDHGIIVPYVDPGPRATPRVSAFEDLMKLRNFSTALLGASLAGCSSALLDPHGPIGRQEKLILIDSTAIMLAIVIPVIIATLVFAWWFRAGNPRAQYK